MLEIGETMMIAVQRMYQDKKTVEEIAQKTGYSIEQVLAELEKAKEISR